MTSSSSKLPSSRIKVFLAIIEDDRMEDRDFFLILLEDYDLGGGGADIDSDKLPYATKFPPESH
jgi:hypothetical protein